jgi:hypothetical protein
MSTTSATAAASRPTGMSSFQNALESAFNAGNLNSQDWQNKFSGSFPNGVGHDSDTASFYVVKVDGKEAYAEVDGDGSSVDIYNREGKLQLVGYYDYDSQGNITTINWLNPAEVDKVDNQLLTMAKGGDLTAKYQSDPKTWVGDAANFTGQIDPNSKYYQLTLSGTKYDVVRSTGTDVGTKQPYDQITLFNAGTGMFVDSFDALAKVKPGGDPTTTGPTKSGSIVRTEESTQRTIAKLKSLPDHAKVEAKVQAHIKAAQAIQEKNHVTHTSTGNYKF